MKELPFELKRMLDALGAKENVPMAQYTSFKTGGSVRILAEPDTAEHTAELMRLIEAAGVEHYVIGNGTNLLISDKGLDAIVVRIGEKMANVERSGRTIIAGAGASYAAMAKQSVQWGLMGLEWAAGIRRGCNERRRIRRGDGGCAENRYLCGKRRNNKRNRG